MSNRSGQDPSGPVVIFDAGRITEMGTHAELLARGGAFANLVKLQQEVAEIIAVKE